MGSLLTVQNTAEILEREQVLLTEQDKEYIMQFAFRTGDRELTDKLMNEMNAPSMDRVDVCKRFESMTDVKPDWIRKIENLLVAVEMYRLEEKKAVKNLSEILNTYGVSMTEEEIRSADVESIKERVNEKSL